MMVGEEVVPNPFYFNDLEKSAGETAPLISNGNFAPSPHLSGASPSHGEA